MESHDSINIGQMQFIEGAHALPRFGRNDFLTPDQIGAYRQHFENTGVYLSAYFYNDIEDINNAYLYGDMYLDFDDEEDLSNSQKDAIMAIWYMKQKFKFNIPDDMFRIYFSGSKGFHIFIPAGVFGITPHKNLNEYFKMIAKDVYEQIPNDTLDLQIYDRRRLLRMVNSIHQKTGLYKIPLTYEQLCTLTTDEIKALAVQPYKLAYPPPMFIPKAHQAYKDYQEKFKEKYQAKFDSHRRNQGKTLEFTPHCVQELLDQGPTKGNRNHTVAVLTSFFVKRGMTEQEIWDNLMLWYARGNQEGFKESEIKTTMQSIIKREVNYGCSTLSQISTCIGSDCPLFKASNLT